MPLTDEAVNEHNLVSDTQTVIHIYDRQIEEPEYAARGGLHML